MQAGRGGELLGEPGARMDRTRILLLAVTITLPTLAGNSAFGQVQSKGQQKCINTLNKDTCKVAATQGKNNAACVKNATKGSPSATCVPNDASGKVAGTEAKTTADEGKNLCTGANAPNFGYGGSGTGNTAAVGAEINLFGDTYGTADTTGVISTASAPGKCQSAVTKDLEKVIATKWKEYLKCKKSALSTATGAAALEPCVTGLTGDAKVVGTVSKLDADVQKNCGTPVSIASAFPGECSGSTLTGPSALAACLDQRAECRICQALNAIDGLSVNCDLFDDGISNASCSLPVQTCTLAAGSVIQIYIAGTPVALPFPLSGMLSIGASGSSVTCDIQSINPVPIQFGAMNLGVLCITPSTATSAPARPMRNVHKPRRRTAVPRAFSSHRAAAIVRAAPAPRAPPTRSAPVSPRACAMVRSR
jgi:hypothetical protein